jgi:hypothetical protein
MNLLYLIRLLPESVVLFFCGFFFCLLFQKKKANFAWRGSLFFGSTKVKTFNYRDFFLAGISLNIITQQRIKTKSSIVVSHPLVVPVF